MMQKQLEIGVLMKERLVDFNFTKDILTRQVNEQFHSHWKLKI